MSLHNVCTDQTSSTHPRAGPTLIGVLGRVEGMNTRDINRLLLEQIESAQDIAKILLNILKNTRGSLEETAEQTSLLKIFELFGRESQGADDAGRGQKESAGAHC